MEDRRSVVNKYMALLQMKRLPVGVRLVYSKEEYDSFAAKELTGPLEYCVSVKCAGLGHSIKFRKVTSGCVGSTRALGFEHPSEEFYDGREGCQLGLFTDPNVAAATNRQVKMLDRELYGCIVKPLSEFEKDPDVVILVGRAREMMRVVQGYTCTYGIQPNMSFSGNQAVCIECTATPLLTGKMNASLMCSGTRFLAAWGEDEIGIGVPYSQFDGLVQGVWDTVNGTEPDDRKKQIKTDLEALGLDCSGMTFGTAYYLDTRPIHKNQ